jgi:acyl-CoA reductase-like NAD-dependent aldehyde dehydrogenase
MPLIVKDPTTEEKIKEFAVGGKRDASAAITAARDAFDSGPWPKMTYSERGKYLCRLADLIDAHSDELALLESLTSGRLLKGVKAWDIPHSSELLRYYASNVEHHCRERHISHTNHSIRREPVGVCAHILPLNFPFPSIFWKMAPALAVGCTVIIKPSERTPLGAQYLARF